MPHSLLAYTQSFLLLLVFLPVSFSNADELDIRTLRTVLRHAPNAGTIVTLDLSVGVNGRVTVAVSDENNRVFVIVRKGSRWRVMSPAGKLKSRATVRLYDLDDDGNDELVIGTDRVLVYSIQLQRLELLWESESLFGFDSPAPQVRFGDCTGDNVRDLVVVNYKNKDRGVDKEPGQESVYLFERSSATEMRFKLSDTLLLTDEHGFHSTGGLVVADFLDDGDSEIAVGNDNGFLWLIDVRNDMLKVVQSWEVPSGGAVGGGMSAGNIDSDEGAELFIGTNGGSIFIYDFDGESVELAANGESGRLAYGVSAADFDSDGIDEFVLSRGHLGYARMTQRDVVLEIYRKDGRKLKRLWKHETADLPRNLVVDVDSDGNLEIVVFSLLGESSEIDILRPTLPDK